MTIRILPVAILLTFAPALVAAQAKSTCAMHPTSLLQMRHCYRPLLIFSPGASDPRLKKQQAAIDAAADDMMDRFVLFLPILAKPGNYEAPLDTPYAILGGKELATIRNRFHIMDNEFAVVLLGEDGEVKLKSSVPVSATRLNTLIDAMPDRKIEMQRLHAN